MEKLGSKKIFLENDYSILIVSDMDQLKEIEADWNQLLENYQADIPFLCFDWFWTWLNYFLDENRLFLLLLYKKHHIAAIAPFIIRNERYKGIIKARKICLIGNVYSPVCNIIYDNLSNGQKKDTLKSIIGFFQNYYKKWDIIELDYIPEHDGSHQVIAQTVFENKLKSREYFCFADWYMDGINFSGEDYIKKLSKKVRGELNRRKKRLNEIGKIRNEIGTDESDFDRHMSLYYQVREKSWKSSEKHWQFHYDIRKMAMRKGWLRCGFLFLDETPIAAQIRLVCKDVVYFMEALHDVSYNKFGPGNILRCEMIKHFIDVDGIRGINQGRGDDPYKKYWTPKRREKLGISIFNKSLKGIMLSLIMTKLLPIFQKNSFLQNIKTKFVTSLR